MNILIIQEYGRHPENQKFRECLSMQKALQKLDQDVDVWGLGHDNYADEPEFHYYDIIINLENYDETGWVPNLSEYKHPYKILWSIDAHVRGMDSYLKTYHSGGYDVILQATKDFVSGYEFSVWFPNCYDSDLIGLIKKHKTIDLGFCGSLMNRANLLDGLTSMYNLHKDIFVIGDSMVETVNSYWIHFNQNVGNDINYRSFETLGCGTVLLTNRNPQYEKLGFEDEVNCLMYGTPEELCYKLDTYHQKYDKLQYIIENGLELAKQHTYDKRAQDLLKIYHYNSDVRRVS